MSQDFKLKFEQYRENDPTANDGDGNTNHYLASAHIRNLGFIWPDGRMMFLNYSYLISGTYAASDNSIVLSFTTHTISLKGVGLKELYMELIQHLPKTILCTEARYNALKEANEIIVNEIIVTEK